MDLDSALKVLLKEFNRYVSFTSPEWKDIQSAWYIQPFKKNQIVTAEGQIEPHLYFILEGVHRLYFLDRNGEEQTLAFGYHANFSGVLYSLISRAPSEYYLDALTHGLMLTIRAEDLNRLFDAYPVMDRWGRLLFQDFLIGRGKREREIMTMTAQERFHRLYKESPHIFQLVPHKYLASYIGMRPETFSRLWKSV